MIRPFNNGDTEDVPQHLNEEFLAQDATIAADATARAAVDLALHGTGRIETGTVLTIGTGLSCRVNDCNYLVAGTLGTLDTTLGYTVVALPAGSTRYLYVDGAGAVTLYTTRQAQNPTGTWYAGEATTDGSVCTAVDDTDADRVAGLADLLSRMVAAEVAIGTYVDETSIADRLDDLEAIVAGGGGGAGQAFWQHMQESVSSARTPEQMAQAVADADVAAHVAALHAGETPGGGGSTPVEAFDTDAGNQSRALLSYIRNTDAAGAETQVDAVTIVWGKYGDGSNGSPDFIDRVNSTWEFGA